MIKSSALYIVIVIALVIALLCSSLIVAAYFYRAQYQRKFRYDLLKNNVNSGVNILLAGSDHAYSTKKMSLFGGEQDSVLLKNICWGMYDVGVARSFIHADTLTEIFSIASKVDSVKWAALYLIDEDRPLSVSGKTEIKGNAFLPKAGVKEAYVDNMAYTGNKKLVQGIKKNSEKALPVLDETRIGNIKSLFNWKAGRDSTLNDDSLNKSFMADIKVISLGKKTLLIRQKLEGYILIRSDTIVTIANTAQLNNLVICARFINVQSGFKGTCQLFATDSIHIEKNCQFEYPSAIGVLQFESTTLKAAPKIIIDAGTIINGAVFSYQKSQSEVKPLISLGDHTTIIGQIYSQGILSYKKQIVVNGSVFTNRFIYQSSNTMYENYLINILINSDRLSRYYLTSDLLPAASAKRKVLQWLK
ncbi:hypothetical protein [Mucilaginibacter polytrichastri]|uniref:Uncharacterized protein n=1 Tax=Mucilaginibacter polytrichastri TaxID=1302689 RepID=A0A1Q5ZZX2_9SPHI|nr:hypothetical protein [Mucilaginibacter polytrichastri]OKS87282.1 hypothetical protein RG47T_2741 [Mucilaginibacter polytrichastri]SFT18542.1 hypothetical protein SAMN04487890_11519 [Mucilaginibacter polytrichastri]